MKKEVIIFIILIISPIFLNGVSADSISGNVYELSDEITKDKYVPINEATIIFYSVDNKTYSVVTDSEGAFLLNFSDNENPDSITHYEVIVDGDIISRPDFNNNFLINPNLKLTTLINSKSIKEKNYPISSQIDFVIGKNYPVIIIYSEDAINYSKRPVLLITGWSNDISDDSINDLWFNKETEYGFENELAKKYEYYKLQYWPANLSNSKNAIALSFVINFILQSHPNFDKLDVISHSMGGLAVRGYIQEMGISPEGNKRSYNGNIRKFVILAGPMYGTYFANIVDGIDSNNLLNKHPQCSELINKYGLNGGSEATNDMEIGSDFIWELNNKPINKSVEYLTIVGRRVGNRTILNRFYGDYCISNKDEINDGVVSVINGNLLNQNIPLIILDFFHFNKCQYYQDYCYFGRCFYNQWFCTDGIEADIKTFNIVDLFLNDNLNSTTIKSSLNSNKGEIYYDPNGGNNEFNISFSGKKVSNVEIITLENHRISLIIRETGKLTTIESYHVGTGDGNLTIQTFIPFDKIDIIVSLKKENNTILTKTFNNVETGKNYLLKFIPEDIKLTTLGIYLEGSFILQLNKSEVILNSTSVEIDNTLIPKSRLEMNNNTGRYFYVNISHIPNIKLDFTTMLPIGDYDLIINGFRPSGKEIKILPGQVNLIDKNLDEDSDHFDTNIFGGSDCNDSNSIEFPNQTWYADSDNDGFSNGIINKTCKRPQTHKILSELISNESDCNDKNNSIRPNALELCNFIDDNCNNKIDDKIICSLFYQKLKLGEETNVSFQEGEFELRFGGLNTNNFDCELRIRNGSDVEIISLITGNQNISEKFKLMINNSICNIQNQTLEFLVSVLEQTPSLSFLSPLNNSILNISNVLVVFNTSHWNVSGKGNTHIHFHIDGMPGLSFSDHLMFYNAPDNIVELNFENGETSFATWINDHTLEINNLPNGKHKLRAHLATASHQVPANPEASMVIEFTVNKSSDEGLCRVSLPLIGSISVGRKTRVVVNTSQMMKTIEYRDKKDKSPQFKVLCKNCANLDKEIRFAEGEHDIVIRCTNLVGKSEDDETNFLVDTIAPQISSTEPKNRAFTNGSKFIVQYNENNLEIVRLFWNPNETREDCPLGKNQECTFNINMSAWNGQEIDYWFEIEDITGKKDVSRKIKIDVDTLPPILNLFNYTIKGRRVEFIFNITETNFDEITYRDTLENRPREKTLCSRLRNGMCEVTKSFKTGPHNLTLSIKDKAENVVEKNISFVI